MINLTKGIQRPHHRIRLTKETKFDIQVWLSFLQNFDGKTFFYTELWEVSNPFELFTDAAGSKGYGAILGKHWFFGAWPETWKHFNITFLEFFPIVIALRIWGPLMANRCVNFNTDNAALVDIINQYTSKHNLVCDLVLTSLRHNIMFRAKHIQGVHNTPADYISRFQVDKFKVLCPGVDEFPTTVPESLLPESWSLT